MPKAKSFQVGSEALARKAAVEVAGSVAVGNFLEEVDEGKGLATYLFESRQKGYVGWRWSVTIFQQTAKSTPTVSEVLMVPGPEAILAPAWVPWSERLADYKALQAELEAQAALDLEESAYDEDDEADLAEDESADSAEESSEPGSQTENSENLAELPEVDEAQSLEESTDSAEELAGSMPKQVEEAELVVSDFEQSQDSQDDTDAAGKKPPRFLRRRKRFGKK